MEIAGYSIVEITQLLTLGGVLFMIFTGIVTKKDCKECKTSIDNDFESGSEEFKKVRQVQTDQGEQLAGISATVGPMAENVQMLVNHHINGGE
jgi:hypothetical protein